MPSFAAVKRLSNRKDGKTGGPEKTVATKESSRAPQSKDKSQLSAAELMFAEKLPYGNQLTQDHNVWCPSFFTAFKLLMSLRLSAAVWSNISDCDEVFNYWEPLHLLLYGSGMQTWEYSPAFALRSYGYVWLYNLPAQIYKLLVPSSKITTFFMVRCCIGAGCAGVEAFLYRTLCERLSRNVGRIYLLFALMSTGMFISSCAFLPSSFSMVINMLAVGLWLRGVDWAAVFFTAVSAMVGWPFAAVLGLPVAVDMLVVRRQWLKFVVYAGLSGVIVAGFLLQVDSYYYGRPILAPVQIVIYNVFSPHGPNLYGVEPLSYYLINAALNFNVAFPLALLSLPLGCLSFYLTWGQKRWLMRSRLIPLGLLNLSMLLWMAIFFRQQHKEERFLFPIYPLLCVTAAICVDSIQRVGKFCWIWLRKMTQPAIVLLLMSFAIVSTSRTFALYRNYHGVFDVFVHLNEKSQEYLAADREGRATVCVGKEWHRFPSSFFLPTNQWELAFIQSEFKGILPKTFAQLPIPNATRLVPTDMNDLNREEPSRYVDLGSCDFLVDFDSGQTAATEPNFAADTDRWELVFSSKFLIAAKSHRLLRSFFIPFLSERHCVFGQYQLLKARKSGRTAKNPAATDP